VSTAPHVDLGHRRLRIGTSRAQAIVRTRSLVVGAGILVALLATAVLALMTGDFSLSAGEVVDVLRGEIGRAHV